MHFTVWTHTERNRQRAITGGPLLMLFFETLEKQQCKQKTV